MENDVRKDKEMPLADNERYANVLYDSIQSNMKDMVSFMIPQELASLSEAEAHCLEQALMEAAAWGAFWTAGFLEGHHDLNDDPSNEMRVLTTKGRSYYLTELLMSRLQEDFPASLVGKPASPP
jgi:hypothetical protein